MAEATAEEEMGEEKAAAEKGAAMVTAETAAATGE